MPQLFTEQITPLKAKNRVHLPYLDGLRGIAALYVVLFHLWQLATSNLHDATLPIWIIRYNPLQFGHFAVAVFIVLSGYCLMLPVTRSPDATLNGGILEFLKRRSRRILPPYFAALLLSILLIASSPLKSITHTGWDIALPALTTKAIVSHILLIHNLSGELQWKINPPMWSVAVEWQIYFIFALVLLPIYRRFGYGWALCCSLVLGLLPAALDGGFHSTQYISLFGLGMIASVINYHPTADRLDKLAALPWHIITSFSLCISAIAIFSLSAPAYRWVLDVLVGFTVACFLIQTTAKATSENNIARTGLLSHPLLVGLGTFSYSLYLIHYPLLALLFNTLQLKTTGAVTLIILLFGGMPLILAFSYCFYYLFEKPFLQTRKPSVAN